MKKVIKTGALLLSVAFLFVGCSMNLPNISQTETVAQTEEKVAKIATEAPTEKATEPVTDAPTQASAEQKAEQVLFDDADVVITYKGLSDGWMGKEVKLKIENNSDTNYTVQVRNVSVNGYMIDPIFSCDVNSGKIANDEISFYDSDLENNEITAIEELEFNFHIYNQDDWMESFDSETIVFHP